jgi:glycosyltransferase involved in cell wall biosynthesis
MNILFLTLVRISDISERSIYNDLLREFRKHGHSVTVVCPVERRLRQQTKRFSSHDIEVLQVKTLNIQKTNLLEKGIGTILFEYMFLRAIKKHLFSAKFDLVMYSTPPITFSSVIKYIKNKHNAHSYLLLKDIFPQNAVDLGFISKGGFLHRYFLKKEESLYKLSDYIGCMSRANVEFVARQYPEFSAKLEVCPNSITPVTVFLSDAEKLVMRKKYGIPSDALVCIYGGNLGKPQGIPFLIEILESNKHKKDLFFIIIGDGTEYNHIQKWFHENGSANSLLMQRVPKAEFDNILQCCDIGLLLLDKRFTIPNFPSRLLSYMEYQIPVISATDAATDVGDTITSAGFGLACLSGELDRFNSLLGKLAANRVIREQMGENGRAYLLKEYSVDRSYAIIMKHWE